MHIEELLGNLHQQAVPCIGNDFQSGFKFLFWIADPVSGYPTLRFFRSGKIFWHVATFSFVDGHAKASCDETDDFISRQWAATLCQLGQAVFHTLHQDAIALVLGTGFFGDRPSGERLFVDRFLLFPLGIFFFNARQKVAQCDAAVANGTE